VTNWMAAGEYGGLAALTAGNDEYLAFARTLQTRINTLCAAANDPDTRRNLEIAREIVASGPREIGKTGLLSIQYGTSPGGLAAQSNIPLALATLMIDEYNLRYPGVAKHQQNLLDAAVAAMRSGLSGRRAEWRVPPMNVRFRYCPAAPGTNLDALEMVRPSGEVVRYLRPQLHEEHRRRTLRTVITHQIYENGTKTYRRDLRLTDQAENCASSIVRDVMAPALVSLIEAGLSPILAVHDEIAVEVLESTASEALQHMRRIMEQPPSWWDWRAPLRTETAILRRYQKV
jgi:hypothetical protein